MKVDKTLADSKINFKGTRNLQSEANFVNGYSIQSNTDPSIIRNEVQQMNQTTSKKVNFNENQKLNEVRSKKLNFLNKFDEIDTKNSTHGTINNDISINVSKKNVSEGLKIHKREGNSQQKVFQKQLQNIRNGQSHSLENQPYNKNFHVNQSKIHESIISTGPSSSQHILRQNSELEGKGPSFIQLKQVFVNNPNQSLIQKKNYIILNKKQLDDKDYFEKQAFSHKEGQFTNTQTNLSKNKFIDKNKNIYGHYQHKNISQNEINNYQDNIMKGIKTRVRQNVFIHSRNSQISNGSNTSNHNEIILGTYGVSANSLANNHTKVSQIQGKGSLKESAKNSYHNTKTSFGIKQSIGNQVLNNEGPQMEVRGNNLGGSISALNRSNYNKFVSSQSQSSKMSNSRTFIQQQSQKHSQVILSKHRNTKLKDSKISTQTQSQLIIKSKKSNEQTPIILKNSIDNRSEQQIQLPKENRKNEPEIKNEVSNQEISLKEDIKNLKVLKNRKSEQLVQDNKMVQKKQNPIVNENIKNMQRISSQNRIEEQSDHNSLPQIFQQQMSENYKNRSKSNEKIVQSKKNLQFSRAESLGTDSQEKKNYNIFDNKLDVIGNTTNGNKVGKLVNITGKTFQNSKDNQENFSMIKSQKQKTVNDRSLDRTEIDKVIANSSLSMNRNESHNNSAARKKKERSYHKQSMDQFSKIRDSEKHGGGLNAIQLAPLQGVPPGTANTMGQKSRMIYKKHDQIDQLQYNFVSQQCNSEIYQKQMSLQNIQNKQFYHDQSENLNSNLITNDFNNSFHQNFEPQFEKLDAFDPNEDLGEIPNIHSKPLPRSQKSQGTYRQNYKKINNMINKIHNIDNYSMSEVYDFQSLNDKSQLISTPNDVKVTMGPIKAQNSDNGMIIGRDQSTKLPDDHPFNGPKLHLFKKGQSKSSQMKQRNSKTGEKRRNNVFEHPHHQENIVYSQQDATSNHGGYFHNRTQLSEEGPTCKKSIGTLQRVSKTKKGHINISEILKENRQNGLLPNNIQSNLDQMYNDSKSHDSQGIISQSSFEIGQGTPLMMKGEDNQQPILDFDNGSKDGTIKNNIKSSIEPDQPINSQNGYNQLNSNQNFSEIMAFETRSQQCPSQMSSLQQNNEQEKSFNLPYVHTSNNNMAGSFVQNENSNSPYVMNNQNLSMHKQEKSEMSLNGSILMMQGDNTSSTRPNTTNPIGNHIYIVNNTQGKGKFVKGKNQAISNFQHPKVGKNSKYPEVFKQSTSNQQSKNNSMIMNQSVYHTTKGDMQPERISKKLNNGINNKDQNSQQIFANYIQNEDISAQQNLLKASSSKQLFEPKQTGDFPAPEQIQKFNEEIEKEQENEDNEQFYKKIQNEINNQNQNSNQDAVSCQTSMKKNNMYSILHQEEHHGGDRFQSLNNLELYKKQLNQEIVTRQKSEGTSIFQQSHINMEESRQTNCQTQTQPNRNFKSRMSNGNVPLSKQVQNLPAIGNLSKFNENGNNKRTIQHQSNTNFQEMRNCSFDKPYEMNKQKESDHQQLNPITLNNKLKEYQSNENLNQEFNNKDQLRIPPKQIPTKSKQKMQTIEDSSKIKFNMQNSEQAKINHSDFKNDNNRNSSQGSDFQISNKNETKEMEKQMRDTNNNNFNSVAQTPCFAETPYTTDQFKGYKITESGVNIPSMMQTGFSKHEDFKKE